MSQTTFSSVSIVDFEQVNINWAWNAYANRSEIYQRGFHNIFDEFQRDLRNIFKNIAQQFEKYLPYCKDDIITFLEQNWIRRFILIEMIHNSVEINCLTALKYISYMVLI